MYRLLILVSCLVLMAASVWADDQPHDESFCPAHRAAERGHTAFETFHHVMAPAWHDAWPDKDYDALFAAGPKFVEEFKGVAAMKPEFKSPTKAERFEVKRTELGKIVDEYAAAAKAGNRDKVYELMPGLHDAFEHTAACLLPTSYKQLNGLLTVSETILKSHLPAKNQAGVVGSTETLVIQVGALTEESIPDDLQYFKPQLLERFTELQDLVVKVKACCDKDDMKGYEEHVTALHATVSDMIAQYL